jgi:hypothetical protein
VGLVVSSLVLLLPAGAAAAISAPPSGTVYPGQVLQFSGHADELAVGFDGRPNCGNPGGGPIVYRWTVHAPFQAVSPPTGSGPNFAFSVVVADNPGFIFVVDVTMGATCGTLSAFSAGGNLGTYTIGRGPPPATGGGTEGGIVAWVQNIVEQMAAKLDPCVAGDIAAGTQGADCGQQGFRRNPQFWKATGSLVCTTDVAHSYSGPFTPITTTSAAKKCIEEFPPPRMRRLSGGRAARQAKPTQAKAGSYRGISVSLAGFGQSPTRTQLRQRGRVLAAFLESRKKPRDGQPISFEVGDRGRSATFGGRVWLTCEDGSAHAIDLNGLPDPSAPLSVSRPGYFKLATEDPAVAARIGGLFLNKRSLAGAFYLGVRIHGHGLCDSLVGYAARRRG